jgi:hypothetical protein
MAAILAHDPVSLRASLARCLRRSRLMPVRHTPFTATRDGKFARRQSGYMSSADALSSGSMSDFAENGFVRKARHPD